jgi:hypothetical protein
MKHLDRFHSGFGRHLIIFMNIPPIRRRNELGLLVKSGRVRDS